MKMHARAFSKFLILMFFMCLSALTTAEAYKEVRGGNGIGGTLRDRQSHGTVEVLDGKMLYRLMMQKFGTRLREFPLVEMAALDFFEGHQQKRFYLESRELHPDCLNSSTAGGRAEIWACQNDVEVRVNLRWWKGASFDTKADLLLHELLTALYFKKEKEGAIEPAFIALSDFSLPNERVKSEFWRLGLSTIHDRVEIDLAQLRLIELNRYFCLEADPIRRGLKILDFTIEISKRAPDIAPLFEHATKLLEADALPWANASCEPLAPPLAKHYLLRAWFDTTVSH